MNIVDMKFSEFFFNKHGQEIFDRITKEIKEKDKDYTELVFKIAVLDFIGYDDSDIRHILHDDEVKVEKIKVQNKKSIKLIQEYLKNSVNEIMNNKK